MEGYIYLTVKSVCAAYILFIFWRWLFRGSGERFWKLVFPVRQQDTKTKPDTAPDIPRGDGTGVVGRTNAVLLTDPKAATSPIVESTDLEPTGYIGQEEELTDEDIEIDYGPPAPLPSDDELYDEPSDYPTNDDYSSGVSFEEIGEAVDVLRTPTAANEQTKNRAAQTLYSIQNTDILDFITREVCASDVIDNLLSDCLDGDGFPKTGKVDNIEDVRIKDFDIQKYV